VVNPNIWETRRLRDTVPTNIVAKKEATMSDLMLDVDQASELKAAFRRHGWTNKEIKWLCEGGILRDVREVIVGRAEIKTIPHLIDCFSQPYVPEGYSVETHRQYGEYRWNPKHVELCVPVEKGGRNTGDQFRKNLLHKQVLNANVLDHLLAHPELIPNEWKGEVAGLPYMIFFLGTTYKDCENRLAVRCLFWRGSVGEWGSCLYNLSEKMGPRDFAAIRTR